MSLSLSLFLGVVIVDVCLGGVGFAVMRERLHDRFESSRRRKLAASGLSEERSIAMLCCFGGSEPAERFFWEKKILGRKPFCVGEVFAC